MSFKLDTNDDEVNTIVEEFRFVLIPTSNSTLILFQQWVIFLFNDLSIILVNYENQIHLLHEFYFSSFFMNIYFVPHNYRLIIDPHLVLIKFDFLNLYKFSFSNTFYLVRFSSSIESTYQLWGKFHPSVYIIHKTFLQRQRKFPILSD